MLTESDPTAALVLAFPGSRTGGQTRKEQVLVGLIEIASRYTDVVILVNRDDPRAIPRIRHLISSQTGEPTRVFRSVQFLRGFIDTEWIRDYGPWFGLDAENELVLLDNMYRDLRSEGQTERRLSKLGFQKATSGPIEAGYAYDQLAGGSGAYLSDYGHFWRLNDDAAPIYFNEILYQRRRRFPRMVRPPLQISGGDAAFTHDGHMFTSTRTLELNGGDERRFRSLAARYFGARGVTYFKPLPRGMWHIDMFFRVARPGVVMIGELGQEVAYGAEQLNLLHLEARETLEWNTALIERDFTDLEIVRVPMPPLAEVKLRSTVEADWIRAESSPMVGYRSFLNSVYLDGGEAGSAVLVPAFDGLEGMETAVAAAYRYAYPAADIHFVYADELVEDFAGLHCVTATVPALDRISIEAGWSP
ncbi:MAG: agmatine deiminase family protein [Holophagales bacterium]|nr:agmatine deiminase family protein [Holophagales bacterium]